ncbi:MAG TPA: ABC transporter permease [Gemmatimonadaceae bacterium]|nr:ABC transporter permease [Gemmatimonadaceae bacterium]
MAWYHELGAAARALFRRERQDRELDEELRFHLDMETERNLRAGLPPDEARRRARLAFGGVDNVREEVRDERGTRWLTDFGDDVRFATRSLRRRAGFTAVAALTLALGIGATTALFGVVKTVLMTPLPYARPDRVAMIWSAWKGFDQTWLSYDEWEAYKADVHAFADVALFTEGAVTLTDGSGEPERLRAGFVGANVFPVLGVAPILGRGFTPEEDRPNGPRVVVLSDDVWRRRFGGDPSVVGRAIQIGGQGTTVVGVMPADFRLPLDYGADGRSLLWLPLATDAAQQGATPGPEFARGGGSHGFYGVARLAPGATVAGANTQLRAFVDKLVRDGIYPPAMQFRAFAVSADDQVTGRVRPALLVVFAAVGFVLLIACANVAGLLLVRGENRRRELAVRVALGAGARRVTRMLLAESLVLAALGGSLGVALAALGTWLVRHTAPAALPRIAETRLDLGVLLFALAVAVAAALLAGVLPALQATRVTPANELKEGGRAATAGAGRLRWRQTLVVAEVALAVVLVAGAGLMIRSVANLFAIDPGFRPDGVLTMHLSTPAAWYPDSVRVESFWSELQRRATAVPGVERAGGVFIMPLATEMGDWGMQVEGYTPPPNEGTPGDWQVVTPGYFETMGIRLARGRVFDARDRMDAPLALVVNRTFADRYFAGREALGGRVRINGSPDSAWYTVVGVVDDVHHNALTSAVKPQFYATLGQFARAPGNTIRTMSLVVRSARGVDPRSLAAPLRAIVRAMDPRLPVSEVRTMNEIVGESIAAPRFAMELLGLFGTLALALSAIGIFGIVSQVVASRRHEFGIRAALGASPAALLRISLGAGVRQAAAGLVVGIAAALLLTRAMTSLLHGVAPADPATFAAVVVVTGIVVLAASVGPARRAAKLDPARVLHEG